MGKLTSAPGKNFLSGAARGYIGSYNYGMRNPKQSTVSSIEGGVTSKCQLTSTMVHMLFQKGCVSYSLYMSSMVHYNCVNNIVS